MPWSLVRYQPRPPATSLLISAQIFNRPLAGSADLGQIVSMPVLFKPFNLLLLLIFCLLVSSAILPGFLPGHGGFGGPHLFGVARNMLQTPGFIGADLVYTDTTFHPYNHHPPLYFWLQAAVTYWGTSFASRLQLAYLFSSILTAGGLFVLYQALRRLALTPSSAFLGVAGAAGTYMFVNYRNIVNFDSASLILSSLILFTIVNHHQAHSRRTLWQFRAVCIFALLTSWYAVTLILVYLGAELALKLRQAGLRAALTSSTCASALITGGFAVALFTLLCLNELHATGALQTLQTAFGRDFGMAHEASAYNPPATHIIFMLIRRLLESLPLHLAPLGIVFAIPSLRRPIVSSLRKQLATPGLLPAAATLIAGTGLFILAAAKWSSIHPFAYIWILPVVALATAMFAQATAFSPMTSRITFAIALLGAFAWVGYASVRDTRQAMATSPLLQVADALPSPTAYVMPDDFNCGLLSDGAFRYITSTPNKRVPVGQHAAPAPYTTVVAECLPPDAEILRFTVPATGQVILVSHGHISIQETY